MADLELSRPGHAVHPPALLSLLNRDPRTCRANQLHGDVPKSRVICSCGSVLKKDEHEHYLYHCTSCVVAEHDLIRRHQRGEDHPDIDALFDGPVLIDGLEEPRRSSK